MRKLLINVIDHDGSDIGRKYNIGDGNDLPDVTSEIEEIITELDTDFETGALKQSSVPVDDEDDEEF